MITIFTVWPSDVPPARLDPAPRSYAPTINLHRRHQTGSAIESSVAEIETWLLEDALRESDALALIAEFAWRLTGSPLGIDRLTLHTATLHPLAVGTSWSWSRLDGILDEIRIPPSAMHDDAFLRSPLFRVIQHGEVFRADTRDDALFAAHPFLCEIAEQGFVHYVAFPIGTGRDGRHNAATVATTDPDGFGPDRVDALTRLFRLFVLHVERHVALRIGENVATTYLGEQVGRRVLDGSIRRYMGESGDAVIWVSDLRGFTELFERLAPDDMLAVLNAYLDATASAVMDAGGEVLKYLGDGLLAGFGNPAMGSRADQARIALGAAEDALARIARLNADPHPELAAIEGWRPLRTGIGLHSGEVFFGNVGAPERLDFTVIGRAVNVASRVEGLCKPLGRDLLMTRDVAELLPGSFDDLGEHSLKGVSEPVHVFGLPA